MITVLDVLRTVIAIGFGCLACVLLHEFVETVRRYRK